MVKIISDMARQEWTPNGGTFSFLCPSCSDQRSQKNRSKKPLRITFEEDAAVWFCHNCEEKGQIKIDESFPEVKLRVVKDSEMIPKDKIARVAEWRGFSFEEFPETVLQRILYSDSVYFPSCEEQRESIGFVYPDEGTKWRSIEGKHHVQKGSAKTPYLLDLIEDCKKIIITEGEFDALAFWSSGHPYAVSLPTGANSRSESLESIKKRVEDGRIEEVYIAVDSDSPGMKARKLLVNLFGREKTRVIDWSKFDVKDANEFLVRHKDLGVAINKARTPLFEGIVRASNVVSDIESIRVGGFKNGAKIGLPGIDDLITVASDQITIVTGLPGSGKSEFCDFTMCQLAMRHDWKFAVFSAENPIDIHVGKICEKYTGKGIFEGDNRLTDEESNDAIRWVDDHFFFLDPSSDNSLRSILARAQVLVDYQKINGLVIDPYNYTDVPLETDAINSMLTECHAFAGRNHIHIWIVAHPQKMYRSQNGVYATPGGMDISGSAAWFSKSDFGITLSRDEDGGSILTVWKCRFRWMGDTGTVYLNYDPSCGRYSSGPSPLDELEKMWGKESDEESQEEIPF